MLLKRCKLRRKSDNGQHVCLNIHHQHNYGTTHSHILSKETATKKEGSTNFWNLHQRKIQNGRDNEDVVVATAIPETEATNLDILLQESYIKETKRREAVQYTEEKGKLQNEHESTLQHILTVKEAALVLCDAVSSVYYPLSAAFQS